MTKGATTSRGRTRKEPVTFLPYFFLSYAHSGSFAESPQGDPDESVREFFDDLVAEVRQQASSRSEFLPGFYDREIPVGSDWKESLSYALSGAQVLVPLYSADYVTRSWPGKEWACFRGRLLRAGLAHPDRRFVPVLWTPLPHAREPEGLQEALDLIANEPDYTDYGLRALQRIGLYHDSYQAVVNALAKRIVTLAENSPIRPSEVPDIDEMTSPFSPEARLAVFSIETAAPTASTVAAGHDPRGYGETSADWRPFPEQKLSLGAYAGQVVERLDFEPEVGGITTAKDARARRPGIIVIDPWFIADENGRMLLESAVKDLPRWVLPVLVLDKPDDASTQKLADQVRKILSTAGALHTNSSRRGANGVSSLDAFVSIVRVLVTEAERQYLRYRSGRYRAGQVVSPPSGNRPSLRGPKRSEGPASTPDPLGGTPDA
jgi:FxsC-like protein